MRRCWVLYACVVGVEVVLVAFVLHVQLVAFDHVDDVFFVWLDGIGACVFVHHQDVVVALYLYVVHVGKNV